MTAAEQGPAKRVVVKVGTHVVTHDGAQLAMGRLLGIVEDLAALRRAGTDVILVSSGAVGMGMRGLGLQDRPTSLGLRQACAAVGQGRLVALYTGAFAELGVTTAQVLLTEDDLGDRDRALCIRTTLMRLLELGVIPILNENDSVSVRELVQYAPRKGDSAAGFGDNDGLSARVAVGVDADLLVMLSDVDGVYDQNPATCADAKRLPIIEVDDDDAADTDSGPSEGGTGGMASKLDAARWAARAGVPVVIAGGRTEGVVGRIVGGEALGTRVRPAKSRRNRHRTIALGARRGALVVNAGALEALVARKASLLPIGVIAVEGEFGRGDVVEIRDGSGRVHGRGLANYDATACRAVAGRHSSEIDAILGYQGYDALVTRDNLVLGDV